MSRTALLLSSALSICLLAGPSFGAGFTFYGRSGDGIEIDFGSLPGVSNGASFSGLSLTGFNGHTVLSSSTLDQGNFASDGRLWVFANPALDTPGQGDTDAAARGFQGRLAGSLLINGQPRTFDVVVQPGFTGVGQGAVGQSLERVNRAANNPLFVAQQQQRLRYLGFVREGGGAIAVDGDFGPNTDAALSTFQAVFTAGNNTTQADVDGIIGPNTAGWLNAGNAPVWQELIDPNPQSPGRFSVGSMIGDFDILPGRDPGTGQRTGLTPQSERFGSNWAINLFTEGAATAKAATGRTQLMNAMSTDDGYGSAGAHSTHRVGTDIDLHVDGSTWDFGSGSVDSEEQKVIDHALAIVSAGLSGPADRGFVQRIIASNNDIRQGINSVYPGLVISDSSGVHLNHLHIDVGRPDQVAGLAKLPGDFDINNRVDLADYAIWRDGLGSMYLSSDYNTWKSNFGASLAVSTATLVARQAVAEPGTGWLAWLALAASIGMVRCRSAIGKHA